MQYAFSPFSISIMQKYNLLKMLNVTDSILWVRDIVNTVWVKLFILVQQAFLMDSYPWEPRFLTQVVLFPFGFLLYAMIAL